MSLMLIFALTGAGLLAAVALVRRRSEGGDRAPRAVVTPQPVAEKASTPRYDPTGLALPEWRDEQHLSLTDLAPRLETIALRAGVDLTALRLRLGESDGTDGRFLTESEGEYRFTSQAGGQPLDDWWLETAAEALYRIFASFAHERALREVRFEGDRARHEDELLISQVEFLRVIDPLWANLRIHEAFADDEDIPYSGD